jgi:hypothetical protein
MLEEIRDGRVGGLIHAGRLEAPASPKVVQTLVFRAGEHVNGVLPSHTTENLKAPLGQK